MLPANALMQVKCLLCGEEVGVKAVAVPVRCPVCGSSVAVVTDVSLGDAKKIICQAERTEEVTVSLRFDTCTVDDTTACTPYAAPCRGHTVTGWRKDQFVMAKKLAGILHIRPQSAQRLVQIGRFPHARKVGKAWRVPLDDVDEYIRQGRRNMREE